MLVPTGGFGWITGDHDVAPRGQSECVLSLTADDEPAVNAIIERALGAGAKVVTRAAAVRPRVISGAP